MVTLLDGGGEMSSCVFFFLVFISCSPSNLEGQPVENQAE